MEICRKAKINSEEFNVVESLAIEIESFVNDKDVKKLINHVNKINGRSTDVQMILENKFVDLGFESEKKRLFSEFKLRPDFYKRISDSSGVLIEVERGKTLANNMDILDVWKCHICPFTNYLILIVPTFRPTKKGSKSKIAEKVKDRLSSFFENENNYINVDALFIIEY